jgi:hypothetical protein
MRINAAFDEFAHVAFKADAFTPSPMAGVERLMLDRIGEERARATSIVRYAPGSRFSEHTHIGGEEILVLDGTFSDHFGHFGPGAYVRNPIGTAHAPWSEEGCTIFVKLMQFDAADAHQFQIETAAADAAWSPNGPGVSVLPLHGFGAEDVRLYRLDADAELPLRAAGGAEVLVLSGSAMVADAPASRWDWLRFPDGANVHVRSNMGAEIYVKTGHLSPPVGAD